MIFFEKILPFLKPGAILIGHSLGAMFLAKYLHSHILTAKMRRIILVAGRYGDTQENGSFDVSSGAGVERSTDEVHLFHSVDDPVVPFDDVMLFKNDIPNSIVHRFSTRGHFIDATFPEMLDLLKQK